MMKQSLCLFLMLIFINSAVATRLPFAHYRDHQHHQQPQQPQQPPQEPQQPSLPSHSLSSVTTQQPLPAPILRGVEFWPYPYQNLTECAQQMELLPSWNAKWINLGVTLYMQNATTSAGTCTECVWCLCHVNCMVVPAYLRGRIGCVYVNLCTMLFLYLHDWVLTHFTVIIVISLCSWRINALLRRSSRILSESAGVEFGCFGADVPRSTRRRM